METRNKIFCRVRRKWVTQTKEEEVRQGLVNYLCEVCNAPLSLMVCEYHIRYNHLDYRADLVLFDRRLKPLLLAECKAPHINLGRDAFDQIRRYNNLLQVPYLILTNSQESYISHIVKTEDGFKSILLDSLPAYSQMLLQ